MTADLVRVLLVEDDEDDFILAQDMLSSIGSPRYELRWMRTYAEAVAAFGELHDVALIDYRLGGGDGLELLREAVSRGCEFPVIMLTGQGDRSVDVEAMRSGAADFLAKSRLDADTLERSIRYAIERKRVQDSLRAFQAGLERRVEERTAELTRVNEALRAEVAERTRAEDALREADRRKDEFLAMLAHELRNPLAAVKSGVGLLAGGEPDPGWILPMVDRQVGQLTRLIDDLLDVSRITRGKIRLRSEPTDLAAAAERAVATVRGLIDERGHTLEVSLPGEPMRLWADPTRLEQILVNLLTNAAKYTDEGGRVSLQVETEGEAARISVRDTGIGMTPETLSRVFDLFAQADRSLDRSRGGLGIGLTLVKRLVELHGGEIEAASGGLGAGSEFVVRLPGLGRAEPAEAVGGSEAAATVPSRPARVLVVDDNRDFAAGLALTLRRAGHEVTAMHDGRVAVAAVRERQPDVVLLDIGLPGVDGYEVARRIRAEVSPCPTLVAVTGYGQEGDRRESAAAGFDLHLVKPIDGAALLSLLSRAASRAAESEEGSSEADPGDGWAEFGGVAETVLVIEDQRTLAHFTKRTLERLGCRRVVVAHDGRHGIDEARRVRPDVVLCDIHLGAGPDGYGVAAALRNDPATRGARLVALTGVEDEGHDTRARAAGFDAALVKPVEIDDLERAVSGGVVRPGV